MPKRGPLKQDAKSVAARERSRAIMAAAERGGYERKTRHSISAEERNRRYQARKVAVHQALFAAGLVKRSFPRSRLSSKYVRHMANPFGFAGGRAEEMDTRAYLKRELPALPEAAFQYTEKSTRSKRRK